MCLLDSAGACSLFNLFGFNSPQFCYRGIAGFWNLLNLSAVMRMGWGEGKKFWIFISSY